MSRRTFPILIVVSLALVAGALLLLPRVRTPRLTERMTAEAIHANVQREADTTFVITGYLDVSTTVRSQDTQVFLPNLLGVRLGTTRATVRVPGRISYGFQMAQLTPEMIRVRGDTIEVDVPFISIYSVEPDLNRLEVETSTGWARLPASAQEAERRAVQYLTAALKRQGEAHLEESIQPEVNSARALRQLIEPVAIALGMEQPHFMAFLGEGLLLEP